MAQDSYIINLYDIHFVQFEKALIFNKTFMFQKAPGLENRQINHICDAKSKFVINFRIQFPSMIEGSRR